MNKPAPKPEEEWDDPYPKKKSMPWLNWLMGIFLVVVFYVLSIGPAIVLMDKRLLPKSVEIIYVPLVRFCLQCPPAERVVQWYIDLWDHVSSKKTRHP
jgi:hypothetical protein